jgi:hypothetical protein
MGGQNTTTQQPLQIDDRGLQEKAKGAPPYPHRQDSIGEGGKFYVPLCTYHRQTEMVHAKQPVSTHLRRLKKCGLSPKTLTNFYRYTIESILSPPGMATAKCITGGKLPALQDTYNTRCHRKAKKIIKDNNHPSH